MFLAARIRIRSMTKPPNLADLETEIEQLTVQKDEAVKAARRAYTRVWSRMSGSERAKYLYRIARIIQERGRELAVLESIDNGKPIKESRDVDIPVVAAHFFYYAGWADKLEHSGYGSTPLGVAGQAGPVVGQAQHGPLVVQDQRLVGGEDVRRAQVLVGDPAGVHEPQAAVDLRGQGLVARPGR